MEGQGTDQELIANQGSDVTLVASSGTNNYDSDYAESHKNSPASSDNSPELATSTEEILQMHNSVNTAQEELYTP